MDSPAFTETPVVAENTDMSPIQITGMSYTRPPSFTGDVVIWFHQLEAHFAANQIKSDLRQLNHLISIMPSTLTAEVRDLITAAPGTVTYTHMKTEILHRTSTSTQKKFHQLLHNEVLGDRTASQLLRCMRQLIDGTEADEALLKQLFFSRLPTNVQAILAPMKNTSSTAQLAESADGILEISHPPLAAPIIAAPIINQRHMPCECSMELTKFRVDVERSIAALSSRMDQLIFQRPNFSARNKSRERSPSPRSRSTWCYFHERFGKRAYKCVQPCAFVPQVHTAAPQLPENAQAGL